MNENFKMETKTYLGFIAKQRDNKVCPLLFAFYAPAKEILTWSRVERASEKKDGVQRILRDSRLSGIRRFLSKNQSNILPNNLLVAFPEGEKRVSFEKVDCSAGGDVREISGIDLGLITIHWNSLDENSRPALVIDGQHRLFGAASFEDEDIPFLVVSILEAKPEEMAFQFIVINNKSVKVPTSLVKSLVANYSEIELSLGERLLTAGISYGNRSAFLIAADNSDSSPFRELLDWEFNRKGEKLVDVTTVESMHSYLKRELAITLSGDEDSSQTILFTIWNTLKERYRTSWNAKSDNFFRKVSMLSINEYVVDRIRNLASMQMVNIFDKESIQDTVLRTFKFIPDDLWTMDWSAVRLQDNKAIRDLIKSSFEIISNNLMNDRDWHHSVKLLSANQ